MIFILGGRGLVGSAFVRHCIAAGYPYTVIDRSNYEEHAGKSCDLFINANGNSSKPLARQQPLADFDASVRSVRKSLLDFQFERYIHLSSCDVYLDCSSPESTREDKALNPALQTPYGFHKFLAEQCVQHGARNWLIIRFGGFVGPGLKKNAIFDILNGGPLWLDPASELQFLHTDDAARLVLELAGKTGNQIVNVCGRGVVRLSDIMREAGRQPPVKPDSPAVRYDVSIEKALQWIDIPPSQETVFSFVKTK